MVDVDMLAATVRQHQVGAFPLGDDAAIVKAQRLRRMFADQTDRLRRVKALSSASAMRNAASSRLADSSRKRECRANRGSPAGGRRRCRSGNRRARYSAPPSGRASRADVKPAPRPGGGKLGDDATQLVGFSHMRLGGVSWLARAIRRARHMAAMVWRLGCDQVAARAICSASKRSISSCVR